MLEELLRSVPRRYPFRRGAVRIRKELMRLLVGDERVAHIGEVRFRFLGHQGLFFFELYEPHVVRFMRSFLRPGDCAIDLGANAGYLSAVALDCVGKAGRLIAVEAAPAHYAELQWLERLNPEHRVLALHCAAGDHDGEISLFLSAHRGWHSTVRGFNVATSPQVEEVRVPLCMLDSLVEREGLMREGAIRLIKIDVEGAEHAVIAGAGRVLDTRAAQALIIEMTPPGPKHPVPEPRLVLDRLARAGYSAFELRSYLVAPRKLSAADIKAQTDVLFLPT
jgi:FkbM family methyltransferase